MITMSIRAAHAEIMASQELRQIQQVKADSDVSGYSINGRSLNKFTPSELLEWRDYYRREVNEIKKDKNGLPMVENLPRIVFWEGFRPWVIRSCLFISFTSRR